MKRIISILLSALMIVGVFALVPVSAGAATIIDSAEFTNVTEPVEGESPVFYAYSSSHVSFGTKDIAWCNLTDMKDMTASDTFEAGKEYSFIVFIRPEEGYEFKTKTNDIYEPDFSATVNGKDAYVYSVSGHKSNGYIEIAYAFIAKESDNPQNQGDTIAVMDISGVTEPEAGNNPVESATLSEGGILNDCGWFDKDIGDWLSTSDTFVDGHIYQFVAYVKAADGYKFRTLDDRPNVLVTINGRAAAVTKVYGWAANEGFAAKITYGEYTVSFNSNGGSGKMEPDYDQRGEYSLPDCDFEAPEGKKFKAWAEYYEDGTQYEEGDVYDVTGDVTFYAVWEDINHEHQWGEWGLHYPATPYEDGEEILECATNHEHNQTRVIPKIKTAKATKSSFTYNGKTHKPTVTVTDRKGKKLKEGVDYELGYNKNNKNVGKYYISIFYVGNYAGNSDCVYNVVKAKNPMTVKAAKKTVSYKKVKKKNVTVSALTVKKAQGAKTFVKASGDKKITVNKKTGKITVKKGIKKKTYTVKVKVTAKGNKNYKSLSKTVSVKINVK